MGIQLKRGEVVLDMKVGKAEATAEVYGYTAAAPDIIMSSRAHPPLLSSRAHPPLLLSKLGPSESQTPRQDLNKIYFVLQ